jgi:hypothetical protein
MRSTTSSRNMLHVFISVAEPEPPQNVYIIEFCTIQYSKNHIQESEPDRFSVTKSETHKNNKAPYH